MRGVLDRTWARVVVVAVVPFLAVATLVWSTSGRSDHIDRIPAAVVNNDQIITGSQPMAAGRALAGALTEPSKPDQNLDWTLTDPADAQAGLDDGTYYAVLTIPQDFSKDILSTGTDNPAQAGLSLVSNSAASTTVPYLSQQVAAAAANALGMQSTQGYLKNVYAGFNQIASSNQQAASSASQLAQGTSQLSQGAQQLNDGTSTLAGSLGQIQTGAQALHAGSGNLAAGADGIRQGADGVADGAQTIQTGASSLSHSSKQLAGSSKAVSAASGLVANRAGRLARANQRLQRASALLANELSSLDSQCAGEGGSLSYCQSVTRAMRHTALMSGVTTLVSLRATALAKSTGRLSSATSGLAKGNAQLSHGAHSLAAGSVHLSHGADNLATGAGSLAQGANTLDQSAGALASGTQQTAAAGNSVANGASSLSSSAGQVDGGAQQLSSGLAKGAKQSPTYSNSEQQTLANVVSQPVLMTHSLKYDDHGNGWLLGLVIGLVLWTAALLGALRGNLTPALVLGRLPISSSRLVLAGLLPALGLALVEAVAVLLVALTLGVGVASFLVFTLLTLVAALVFTSIGYALRLLFGRAGVPVLILFLFVQAAALGNVVPIETAPGVLRALNGIFPLTRYVEGASQLISGGHVGSVTAAFLVLVVWGLLALVAAVAAVGRRRLAAAPPAQRETMATSPG